ncbi:P-loop containing nucleoside triphosphate hydrolase protein [Hypoxylon sp. FL0890]|nr:P-loop containing nucleoside triphosphate hydrolase protein [Hypoxylon sp. FL0890]
MPNHSRIAHNHGLQVGQNSGPITANIHLPSEEHSETTPKPTSTVPFCRDTNFVERGDLVQRIKRACSGPASRAALVGLGGVGKSQLAIEYAYRHEGTGSRELQNNCRRTQAFRPESTGANVLQLVEHWLSNEHNGKWFMVLDSADDPNVFYDTKNAGQTASSDDEERPIWTYLPQSANGSILVTTRNRELAWRLTGDHKNIIDVGPMDPSHALTLLATRCGDDPDMDAGSELVKELECIPLAISQAGAYIQQRWPRMSSIPDDLIRPVGLNGPGNGKYTDDENTGHFNISREDDEAETTGDEATGSSRDLNEVFEDDIATLRKYCLIKTNETGHVFEMHALVQLSTAKWLAAYGDHEVFKQAYLARMARAFPHGGIYENWETCRRLFAHVEIALNHRPKHEESLKHWALVLLKGGYYAFHQARLATARKMAEEALPAFKKICGEDSKHTLNASSLLSVIDFELGFYKEAESLFLQELATRKEVMGPDHPDTLASMHKLASIYWRQERFEEAEELQVRVVEARKRILGIEHPDTLETITKMALIYESRGRIDDAVKLMEECAEGYNRVLGPEHPRTQEALSELNRMRSSKLER